MLEDMVKAWLPDAVPQHIKFKSVCAALRGGGLTLSGKRFFYRRDSNSNFKFTNISCTCFDTI